MEETVKDIKERLRAMGTDLDAMREVAFKIKGDIDHSSADIAGLATNIFSVYFFCLH